MKLPEQTGGETGSSEEEQQQRQQKQQQKEKEKEIHLTKKNNQKTETRKPVDSSAVSSSFAAVVLDYWRGEMAVTGDETESGRVALVHVFACWQKSNFFPVCGCVAPVFVLVVKTVCGGSLL